MLKDISKHGPSWYDPWNNTVSRKLAEEVAKLAESCKRLHKVFAVTLDGGPDAFLKTENFVVDAVLRKTGQSLNSLSFEAIRERALEDKKNKPLQAMDLLFKEGMSSLRSESLMHCSSGFKTSVKLAALSRYAFDDTAKSFEPGIVGTGRKREPRKQVPAEAIIRQLEDLHFLVAELNLDEYARDAFLLVHRCANLENYTDAEASADFKTVASLISTSLGTQALQKSIKATYGEPYREFAAYTVDMDIRKDVGARLMLVFNERRAIMHKNSAEEGMDSRMNKIFGDMALPPLKGWSQHEDLKLLSAGLPGLSGILTFSLLKNFLKVFYVPVLRVAISEAIMDLDFCDPQFRFCLSDEADEMGALLEELEEFEESVAIPGHSRYAMVLGSIRGIILDAMVKLPHRKIIIEANFRAENIIQKIYARTAALAARLSALRDDLKNCSGIYINKIMGGDTKKAIRARALMDAAQKIRFLNDILQHTAADANTAGRILRQRSALDAQP